MHVVGHIDRAVAFVATLLFTSIAAAQSSTPFVPADFKVPEALETKEFRLRMLTVNDVVKDYDAVMTSVEHLKSLWPGSKWPEGLTFEVEAGELEAPEEGLPRITQPGEVWPHTAVEFVGLITPDGELSVEIGCRVAWDEEHILGARPRNGRLIELNGSVLPP